MTNTQRAWGQQVPRGPLLALEVPVAPTLEAHEVELEVVHCSVCHSDVHLLDGDWGEPKRPLVPGHEVLGRVLRVGARATVPVGSLVGLGWQAGCCGQCVACATGREHLCTGGKKRTCVHRVGGFAQRVLCDEGFCFALPEGLDPATAAPLLCAGLTVFSPLERFRVGPGTRVGVVGFGGLGHLAVRFASALGASVVAFDPDRSKAALARSLGAAELRDTEDALPQEELDLLLVTTHAPLLWTRWFGAVALEGTLCLVGVPGEPVTVAPDPLLDGQKCLTGSVIGSPATMRRMLAFAAQKGIAPVVERMPMSRAAEALDRVREGRARMRIVLDA